MILQKEVAEGFGRAIGLATAVAQMDYADRIATINAVVSAPGPMSSLHGLLMVLAFAGEIMSAAYARQGFDEALASYLAQQWHSQNEWWVIERWIELIAFSDAPQSVIDCVDKLPGEFKHAHYFDRILSALGFIDPGQSIEILTALAARIVDITFTHSYIYACAQIGTVEAARHLVTVACTPPIGASNRHDTLGLSTVLSTLLSKYPGVRQELIARTVSDRGLAAYPVLARLLSSIIGPDDIPMLLRAWDARGGNDASQILERAVHDLTFKDRPIDGSNAFEREPSDLSSLRAALFQIYVDGGPQALFAARLLQVIDSQRDIYGRPPSEPRHPNLSLNVPWPREAASLSSLSGDEAAATPT
jgi:hypothetical protein